MRRMRIFLFTLIVTLLFCPAVLAAEAFQKV